MTKGQQNFRILKQLTCDKSGRRMRSFRVGTGTSRAQTFGSPMFQFGFTWTVYPKLKQSIGFVGSPQILYEANVVGSSRTEDPVHT